MITMNPVISKKDSPVLYSLLLVVISSCLFLMTMLPCNSLADDSILRLGVNNTVLKKQMFLHEQYQRQYHHFSDQFNSLHL